MHTKQIITESDRKTGVRTLLSESDYFTSGVLPNGHAEIVFYKVAKVK